LHTTQASHPQYGKIKDPDLDEGDFVFALKMEPASSSAIPESASIRDYDKIIQKREAKRKRWDLWQKSMETNLAKVERYDKNSTLDAREKAEAWEGLLTSYRADNPYTVKDDEFRRKAKDRISYWKGYKVSGKLFVDTTPSNVTVKILNIGPKFCQGMELRPGRYHVETSRQGYVTKKMWIELEAGENKKLEVSLEPLQRRIAKLREEKSRQSVPRKIEKTYVFSVSDDISPSFDCLMKFDVGNILNYDQEFKIDLYAQVIGNSTRGNLGWTVSAGNKEVRCQPNSRTIKINCKTKITNGPLWISIISPLGTKIKLKYLKISF